MFDLETTQAEDEVKTALAEYIKASGKADRLVREEILRDAVLRLAWWKMKGLSMRVEAVGDRFTVGLDDQNDNLVFTISTWGETVNGCFNV